jgi:glycerol-3-phosphate acyltransferase PlsY
MQQGLVLALTLIGAYLLGSVPFAYLFSRWIGGVDIRTVGDGNVGARNTYHSVSRLAGVLTGAADIGKGMLAVGLTRAVTSSEEAAMVAGMAAVLGHDFSIFLGFQGGQGMAAMIGSFLILFPLATLAALLLFAVSLALTHNWDAGWTIGFIALILFLILTGQGWLRALYAVLLIPTIGLRKLLQFFAARRRRIG